MSYDQYQAVLDECDEALDEVVELRKSAPSRIGELYREMYRSRREQLAQPLLHLTGLTSLADLEVYIKETQEKAVKNAANQIKKDADALEANKKLRAQNALLQEEVETLYEFVQGDLGPIDVDFVSKSGAPKKPSMDSSETSEDSVMES